MAKKAKTAKEYFLKPTKTCAKWVLNKQKKERPPSVGDEGARARLTMKWWKRQQDYKRCRKSVNSLNE